MSAFSTHVSLQSLPKLMPANIVDRLYWAAFADRLVIRPLLHDLHSWGSGIGPL